VAIALDAEIGAAVDDNLVSFITEDISLGGAKARGNLVAAEGNSVFVVLVSTERILPVWARVVACEVALDEGVVQLRLAFEHLSAARRQALGRLLAEFA
jgi:hypothetical protein